MVLYLIVSLVSHRALAEAYLDVMLQEMRNSADLILRLAQDLHQYNRNSHVYFHSSLRTVDNLRNV